MRRLMGVGLNKEEAEEVRGCFDYDKMWVYLQDQNIRDERITRLGLRIDKALKEAISQEMI